MTDIIGGAAGTIPPGASIRVELTPTTYSITITQPEPVVEPEPAARQPFLVGMEGYAGAETVAIGQAYPGLRAMRDFGVKLGTDSLPSLTPHGSTQASQIRDMPSSCRPHMSFKQWDEARIRQWLDTMPMGPSYLDYWPEYDITYHHEPHGDYPDPWPSTYRTRGARLAQIIRAHPNSGRIRFIGPVVTRWWLLEGTAPGNPLDWWHEGANAYGLDCYEDKPRDGGRAWTPEELFAPALEKLYAALPEDVTILVPEWGRQYEKGQKRADMIAADLDYLRTQHPRVFTACYYNHEGGGVYSFSSTSPEAAAFRSRLALPA